MVSADNSAGEEEGRVLNVPEHAKKLHLRWEKEESVLPGTTPGQVPDPKDLVTLPPELRKLMEDGGFGDLGDLSEEEIPRLFEHVKERLETERNTFWILETRKSQYGPEPPFVLLNQIDRQKRQVDRFQKIKFEFDRWRSECHDK